MRRAIVEDTRQQVGKHGRKHDAWEARGETLVRCALPFGDYALAPRVAVDTKSGIGELVMDLTTEHDRFRRECELARACGSMLVVLVENEDGVTDLGTLAAWSEPEASWQRRSRRGAKRRWFGKRFAKACETMQREYGVRFAFCTPDEAADVVSAILEMVEGGGGDGTAGTAGAPGTPGTAG